LNIVGPVPIGAARKRGRYRFVERGYEPGMRTDDDTRSVEQEVAAGQSETTPVAVLTSVVGVVAILFLLALGLAALAYFLA
jgi:hypothetical protein